MTTTMTEFDLYMNKVPKCVGRYIFSFLIPDESSIEFGDYGKTQRDNSIYSLRYEVAFCGNRLLENFKGIYLSRILKKNGKHRYYLTTEKETHYCQGCGMEGCRSEYCRGGWEYEKWYESKYVGKNLENALFKLFLNVDLWSKKIEMPNVERIGWIPKWTIPERSGERRNRMILQEYQENVTSDW
jgi:hypothetical protein